MPNHVSPLPAIPEDPEVARDFLKTILPEPRGGAFKCKRDIIFYVAVVNGNPNGNPDSINMPRFDPETNIGLITDVSIKRRLRDAHYAIYGSAEGMDIYDQCGTNKNRFHAEICEAAGLPVAPEKKKSKKSDSGEGDSEDDGNSSTKREDLVFCKKACEKFWDIRTFGAVMGGMGSAPSGAGVTGAVQVSIARSLDPVYINTLTITNGNAPPKSKQKLASLKAYIEDEIDSSKAANQTFGKKSVVSFGLYEVRMHVMPTLAEKSGFSEEDFEALLKDICNMYEFQRSAAIGETFIASPIIIFKHVGDDDANEEERANQEKIGAGVSAQKLYELVSVERKQEVSEPRSYRDYNASIALSRVPKGVEVWFKTGTYDELTQTLPSTETWFTAN